MLTISQNTIFIATLLAVRVFYARSDFSKRSIIAQKSARRYPEAPSQIFKPGSKTATPSAALFDVANVQPVGKATGAIALLRQYDPAEAGNEHPRHKRRHPTPHGLSLGLCAIGGGMGAGKSGNCSVYGPAARR